MESQYIELTKELVYEDCPGRTTILKPGAPGVILDENSIPKIQDLTTRQTAEIFYRFTIAQKAGDALCFICGLPVQVRNDQYKRIEKPKITGVAGSLLY